MKRRVVTYNRVSTDEQAQVGYSIPAQQRLLRDYAAGHELAIVKEFVESQSAFKEGRPVFGEMVDFLEEHPEVETVLVYKIDRLARNLLDYAKVVERLGVEVISATEELPGGASGKAIGGIFAVMANVSSEQLSERVALGMQAKAASGKWPTGAPLGYLNDPETKGIVLDPQRAPLIRELFENYARGKLSLADLTIWARERGLKARRGGELRKSRVYSILKNPVYYGLVPWRGKVYQGVHEPLVSEALFRRVQERLSGGRKTCRTKHVFPFRGLLECGYCGCSITATLAKGKYAYYHCTRGRGPCDQSLIRQDRLSEALAGVVEGVHLTGRQIGALLEEMSGDKGRQEKRRLARLDELKTEQRLLEQRLEATYTDKIDGKISERQWLALDEKWSRQAELVRNQITELDVVREPQWQNVEATLKLLERAPKLYSRRNDEERARLVDALVSNCVLRSGNIEPIYRSPFDLIAAGRQTANWYTQEDSNCAGT